MNDDQLRELFGEMREEGAPAESLARVRRAVGEAVESRRRVFRAGWKIAVLLAAAGCLGVVMWRPRTAGPAQRAEPVQTAPPVPSPAVAVEQRAPVKAVPAVRRRTGVETSLDTAGTSARATTERAVESGASEIRIESDDDPDVVILLIGG